MGEPCRRRPPGTTVARPSAGLQSSAAVDRISATSKAAIRTVLRRHVSASSRSVPAATVRSEGHGRCSAPG
jgi:hypothetical protein